MNELGGRIMDRSNVGYATTAPQPVPQPVPSALNELDNQGARLHERINLLEQRLSAILSPLPPTGVAEGAKGPARAGLAVQIGNAAYVVGSAADRVDSIINRLEL